jgi:seryl-tRNA synthetase
MDHILEKMHTDLIIMKSNLKIQHKLNEIQTKLNEIQTKLKVIYHNLPNYSINQTDFVKKATLLDKMRLMEQRINEFANEYSKLNKDIYQYLAQQN